MKKDEQLKTEDKIRKVLKIIFKEIAINFIFLIAGMLITWILELSGVYLLAAPHIKNEVYGKIVMWSLIIGRYLYLILRWTYFPKKKI